MPETIDLTGEKQIAYGTRIKALGSGRVGGRLVYYTDARRRDLSGEYFDKTTDFGETPKSGTITLYHHALDAKIGASILGHVDTVKFDDEGIWIEAQLDLNHKYAGRVQKLVERGALSWSSGALPQTARVDTNGHIRTWHIFEASLTPTPAEPFGTRIQSIKSLGTVETLESLMAREGLDVESEGNDHRAAKSESTEKEATMAAIKNTTAIIEAVVAEVGELSAEQIERLTAAIESASAPADVEAVNAASPDELAMEEIYDEAKATAVQKAAARIAQSARKHAEFELKKSASAKFAGYAKAAPADAYAAGTKARTENGEAMSTNKSAPWASNGAPVEIEHLSLKAAYGNLDPRDISAALDVERLLSENGKRVQWNSPASKSLLVQTWAAHALEMAEKGKLHLNYRDAHNAARIKAMKADELDNTGQTGYGPEYVNTNWRDQLWETARAENIVLPNFVQFEMTAEIVKRAIRSTRGTVYHPIEPIDLADGDFSGGTVTTSKLGTAAKTWTAQELAISIPFSTRLDEDSIIPFGAFVRETAIGDLSRSVDHVLIQGDNATTLNINYDGDTTPTTADYTVFDATWLDGLANGVDGGGDAITYADTEALRRKMSIEVVNVNDMVYFVDPYVESYIRMFPEFITADKYGGVGTSKNGEIGMIGGVKVLRTPVMLKTASDGKITYNSAGTLGRLLLVHLPSYELGWRRRMDVYLGTSPDGRAQLLTVNARLDLQNNALTGRAAGLYNVLA